MWKPGHFRLQEGIQAVPDKYQSKILVAGTGPAGLIAALAFANRGYSVLLAGPEANDRDERTTALMMPAIRFLQGIHDMAGLVDAAAPLKTMRIADATSRLIRSPFVSFKASEIGEDAFGFNFTNRSLNRHLALAIAGNSSIVWKHNLISRWNPETLRVAVEFDDGTEAEACLAVAADGRNSPARAAIGIATRRLDYRQSAFVTNFEHELDHEYASTEFHTDTGPFTQVPLPGNRSSLVWMVRPQTADELMAMEAAALSRAIEERMQSMLGKVKVGSARQVYPLSVLLARSFARRRIALIGEAAHVFPPIGAQGLNLGIRDVSDLISAVEGNRSDPGADDVLARYNRLRRPDILARTGSVHLLNQSLLSDMLPAQLARHTGLSLLDAFAPLRGFFMREGMHPGSGFQHFKSAAREQIRR